MSNKVETLATIHVHYIYSYMIWLVEPSCTDSLSSEHHLVTSQWPNIFDPEFMLHFNAGLSNIFCSRQQIYESYALE